jgi:hypothetical protein
MVTGKYGPIEGTGHSVCQRLCQLHDECSNVEKVLVRLLMTPVAPLSSVTRSIFNNG